MVQKPMNAIRQLKAKLARKEEKTGHNWYPLHKKEEEDQIGKLPRRHDLDVIKEI